MRMAWGRGRVVSWAVGWAVALLVAAAGVRAAEPAGGVVAVGKADAVGVDAGKLEEVTIRMQKAVADKHAAGVVTLVARKGQVVHFRAVGEADIENQKAMSKDALFAIASMTKPITATAVLICQDDGKLSVNDPVSKYIPSFKNVTLKEGKLSREMTIRDLMTHTSGINPPARKPGDADVSLEAFAEVVAGQPLNFEPGSKWVYGQGLHVAGRIVEIVSGKPFDVFLEERIFQPLAMTDTTFRPTAAQRARMAKLYKPGADKKSLEVVANFIVGDDPNVKRTPNPSGGLVSSTSDIWRFYQMIANGGELNGKRIVSAAAVKQMTTIQTGDITAGFSPGHGWGLGWGVVREPIGPTKMLSPGTHGHGGAFGTQVWIDPKQELVLILMVQRTNFGSADGSDIRSQFQDAAVAAIVK